MKSQKQSSITLTPEQFVDSLLADLESDLYVTCCMNVECDGWHPRQDEDNAKAIAKARKKLLKWYKEKETLPGL